jgi:hypothetical protein
MNTNQLTASQDRFGRTVAARLSAATAELPYEVAERLRAARTQAVASRKRVASMRTAPAVFVSGGVATLSGDGPLSWWHRVGALVPLVAVVAGLVLINAVQNESRANEVAEVDAALLTDDLPPAAYADQGFIQFLKQTSAKE